jgi:hypothetical protein
MKNKAKSKGGKRPKLKLEYLRQIHKNLMFHVTQPHEQELGMFGAPSIVLLRVLHVLGTLTTAYKKSLKLSLAAEKSEKKHGKAGPLGAAVKFMETIIKGMK